MTIQLPPVVQQVIRRYTRDDNDARVLVEQIVGAVRFALDRAAAHQTHPQQFPLPPGPDSLECHFASVVRRLPDAARHELAATARTRLAPTPAGASPQVQAANRQKRQAVYGVAGLHEPTLADPIHQVISRLPIPAGLRETATRYSRRASTRALSSGLSLAQPPGLGNLPDIPGLMKPLPGLPQRPAPGAPSGDGFTSRVPTALRLTITDVFVVDKTNELNRDEISFGAVVLNAATRQSYTIHPVDLGKFKAKNEKNEFRPVQVAEIPLAPGVDLGQFVHANLFLAEIDNKKRGGFTEFVINNGNIVSDEFTRILDEVSTILDWGLKGFRTGAPLLAGLAGSVLSGAALGLVGAAAGFVVGIAVGVAAVLVAHEIGQFLSGKDEIFGVEAMGQSVQPHGALDLNQVQTVRFEREHAVYDLTFRWDVVLQPGEQPPPAPPPVGELPALDETTALNNLNKVDHIIVLMLENRSFDHMLGYLTALRGRSDVDGLVGNETNPCTEEGCPANGIVRVGPLSDTVFELDPPHDVNRVRKQVQTTPPMSGFANVYVDLPDFKPGKHRAEDILGFYRPEHVPMYDFIASEFAISDRWFCSYPGNTWINRTIALTGAPARDKQGRLFRGNEMPVLHGRTARSFFRVLDEFNATVGPDRQVDWRAYTQDFSSAFLVDPDYVPLDSPRLRTMEQFLDDLASGDLPHVAWLDPNYVDIGPLVEAQASEIGGFPGNIRFPLTANDDHPPTDVAHAQALVATLVFAMMNSPKWEKILFVITYDEHGGFYDHVPPPPNRATPETDSETDPDGYNPFAFLGPRVPALVVSPWVERGAVCNRNVVFDHTSIIKTILARFCRKDGQIPDVSERVAAAPHLGHLLTRSQPREFTAARSTQHKFFAGTGEATKTPTAAPSGTGYVGKSSSPASQADASARSALSLSDVIGTVIPVPVEPTTPQVDPVYAARRDAMLSALGKRLILADARPEVDREPTDLERDIAAVRDAVAAQGTPVLPRPTRPSR